MHGGRVPTLLNNRCAINFDMHTWASFSDFATFDECLLRILASSSFEATLGTTSILPDTLNATFRLLQ